MSLLEDFASGFEIIADEVEGRIKKTANFFESYAGETTKMLVRYFSGSETEYDYPVSKLRSTKTVQEGERINHERLMDALQTPGSLRKKKFTECGDVWYGKDRYSTALSCQSEMADSSDMNHKASGR